MATTNAYINNSLVTKQHAYFTHHNSFIRTAYTAPTPFYRGQAVGESYAVRLENKYVGNDGYDVEDRNIVDRIYNVTVKIPSNVGVNYNPSIFGRASGAKDGSDEQRKVLDPAGREVSKRMETRLLADFEASVYHAVGSPGTSFTDYKILNESRVLMQEYDFPMGEKKFLAVTPAQANEIANTFVNNRNQPATQTVLNEGHIRENFSGFQSIFTSNLLKYYESQVDNNTGAQIAVAVVEGATTLTLKGLGSFDGAIIAAGTRIDFTTAQVRGCNINNITVPGRAFQCRTIADSLQIGVAGGFAAGEVTVSITPVIRLKANVNLAASDGSAYAVADVVGGGTEIAINTAVTLYGTYQGNYSYISPAICLDPVDMGEMDGWAQGSSTRDGVHMTIVKYSEPKSWTKGTRLSAQSAWGFDPSCAVLHMT